MASLRGDAEETISSNETERCKRAHGRDLGRVSLKKTAQTVWLSIVGLGFGIVIGVKFADIDLRVLDWLLSHRAHLTHGAACLDWW